MKWLGLEKPRAQASLHPRRDLELDLDYDTAYDRVLASIEAAIGANVTLDDRPAGRIEAAFGVVNSERIACTIESLGEARTALRIEARFPAASDVPQRSGAVDALADTLRRPPCG